MENASLYTLSILISNSMLSAPTQRSFPIKKLIMRMKLLQLVCMFLQHVVLMQLICLATYNQTVSFETVVERDSNYKDMVGTTSLLRSRVGLPQIP